VDPLRSFQVVTYGISQTASCVFIAEADVVGRPTFRTRYTPFSLNQRRHRLMKMHCTIDLYNYSKFQT